MIQQLANVRRIKPVSARLPSVLGKYAIQKVLTYSIITVLFTALCVSVFNSLELKAEFAMAVVGSLIGGFLGAMLAAVLMLDMQSRIDRDGDRRSE